MLQSTGIALAASVIAGALWRINPDITFFYGGGVGIIAVLLFIALRKKF